MNHLIGSLVGRRADGSPRKYIDVSRYRDNAANEPIAYNGKDRLLRVSLFTVTDFEGKRDTTISTKTFMPKIEWDPEIIERYKIYDASELDEYIESVGSIY